MNTDYKVLSVQMIFTGKNVYVERVEYKDMDYDGNVYGPKKVYYTILTNDDDGLVDCTTKKTKALKIAKEFET